ncbi:MarR family winged helix-turn-helix transcriptional regulator [Mycobacterium hubeiense]|uniref:MarR family winged helix-turn-helix transcriptional regulator n=1 Tax=Mycobacterium hubeiense TaxID=1867256 RepID=UPI001E2D74A5|nr:MarR family transcriptional regulator [Mycobacterium sp. QGD 101]
MSNANTPIQISGNGSCSSQVGLEPLPHSEFEVLRTVADNPAITVTDAARLLAQQPSNVSTTVRRLVQRGLVERIPDARDGRSIRLQLTGKAVEYKKLIDAFWVDAVRRQLSEMSDEEAALVAEAAPLFRRFASMV